MSARPLAILVLASGSGTYSMSRPPKLSRYTWVRAIATSSPHIASLRMASGDSSGGLEFAPSNSVLTADGSPTLPQQVNRVGGTGLRRFQAGDQLMGFLQSL